MVIARLPVKKVIAHTLRFLLKTETKLPKAGVYTFEDLTGPAVLSLCEAATAHRMAPKDIRKVLDRYISAVADQYIATSHRDTERNLFLRGITLRAVVEGNPEPSAEQFIPKRDEKEKRSHDADSRETDMNEVMGALIPWYFLRAQLIADAVGAADIDFDAVRGRAKGGLDSYQSRDFLPAAKIKVRFEALAWKPNVSTAQLTKFDDEEIKARAEERFDLQIRLSATRIAFRTDHLAPLRGSLESSCRLTIESAWGSTPEDRAGYFIELGRAVMAESKADAAVYFDNAIEAVSKFGDELTQRWQAMINVARRAAEASGTGAELTFRLVRCGEMVDSVTNGDHWEPGELFRTAVRLHPPSALAALSRWRDRGIGSFDQLISELAGELVKQKAISPNCGWAFTGFRGCNASSAYTAECLAHTANSSKRKAIVDSAIQDMELSGRTDRVDSALSRFAAEFPELETRLSEIPPDERTGRSSAHTSERSQEETITERKRIEAVIGNADVLDVVQLGQACGRFQSLEYPRDPGEFWKGIVERVPRGKESEFLDTYLRIENLNYTEVTYFVSQVRSEWLQKVAVKRAWMPFLVHIGQQFAIELTHAYRLSYWTTRGEFDEDELDAIRKGIVAGLAESLELVGATTFFSFVSNIASRLMPVEAVELLDFALQRFERHIPEKFGDGPWHPKFAPPEDLASAVAGLFWSALASPFSAIRWEAAHCVRRLAEFECAGELGALVEWMRSGQVGAFGGLDYPFYLQHARLYLMIAFSRIAVDHPHAIRPHHVFLAETALSGLPHALIQKCAGEMALRIEGSHPGTYSVSLLDSLGKVGVSSFPFRTVTSHDKLVDIPKALRKPPDLAVKISFDIDFDHYWFPQIGRIFGVPDEQIDELASTIAGRDIGVVGTGPYNHPLDPRNPQWNSGDYYERGTSHSHGSYPRNDTYHFYYSYHSFLIAAATLLRRMPVVQYTDGFYEPDAWNDWFRRHWLTRADGRWLADRRDPCPSDRRKWVENQGPNWRWEVGRDDFIDVLTLGDPQGRRICVSGSWTEKVNERYENMRVRCALVNRDTGPALASALRSSRDCHDYILPRYGNEDGEFITPPFELTGWIKVGDGGDNRLDYFDPHAQQISYPPDEIGESYATMLGLKPDNERRVWNRSRTAAADVATEIWNDCRFTKRDEPTRGGDRMTASLGLLKDLCFKTGKDIIFSVEIDRRIYRDYRSRTGDDDIDYLPYSHKIFLLSSDGILRDTGKSIRLG